jgi:hypothetical protein
MKIRTSAIVAVEMWRLFQIRSRSSDHYARIFGGADVAVNNHSTVKASAEHFVATKRGSP